MDRGFGSTYRGPAFGGSNVSGYRSPSDKRYDDFYSDNRRGGGGGRTAPAGGSSGGANRNRGAWGGGANRERGFFNQGGQGSVGRNRGNVDGQMLAALQQQQNLLSAFMTSQARGGLLPPPRGDTFGAQRGGRFGGGGVRYGNRPGEKRRADHIQPSGFKRTRTQPPPPRKNSTGGHRPKSQDSEKKEKEKEKMKEELQLPDIPDDEVEISDSLMDSVEKLRQRKEVERNVADEDVQKLQVFSFNGKGYQCVTCGIHLMKESAFHQHLMSKPHVMSVIEARSTKKYQETRNVLDIDLSPDDWYEKNEKARAIILKQAKMFMKTQLEIQQREIETYNKNPGNFFTVKMGQIKAAMKHDDIVTFKLLMESTLEVKDFEGDKLFGFEFIKPVTKFNCRLCGLDIKDASGVIPHVESRLHKNNYQFHIKQKKDYEKTHQERNKGLSEVLTQHSDSYVLLAESPEVPSCKYISEAQVDMVRVPELLAAEDGEPGHEKKTDAKEAPKEEESSETTEAKEKDDGGSQDTSDSQEETHVKIEPTEDVVAEEGDVKEDAIDDESQDAEIGEDEEQTHLVTEGELDFPEEQAAVEEEAKQAAKPKKSILKKPSPARGRGGSALAKRGRGRGKVAASPRSARVKKVKNEGSDSEPATTQEDSNDGSFMEAFHVVDEVEEE